MMKRMMNALFNIFIISSLLLINNCKSYEKKMIKQLITPQPVEFSLGHDIDLTDNPLKVSSQENHLDVKLLYIRQSKNIQKFQGFTNKRAVDKSIFIRGGSIGHLNVKSIDADPGMIFVIMTINFRFQQGRKGYNYKVIEHRKISPYVSAYTTKEIKYVMGKITKSDMILYDKENNDYYYTAFAVTHTNNKELTGYFFDYSLYQFPYNRKYTPFLRIKTKSKEVMTCFGKSVNIVFMIPKDAILDHLKIGEVQLTITSS